MHLQKEFDQKPSPIFGHPTNYIDKRSQLPKYNAEQKTEILEIKPRSYCYYWRKRKEKIQ